MASGEIVPLRPDSRSLPYQSLSSPVECEIKDVTLMSEMMADKVEVLTVREAAHALRCHENHIYQLIHIGDLEASLVGRKYLIPIIAVFDLLARRRVGASSPELLRTP